MSNRIRRKGGKFRGMDVLFLTTVGAKIGERRETPVAWFPDRDQHGPAEAKAHAAVRVVMATAPDRTVADWRVT